MTRLPDQPDVSPSRRELIWAAGLLALVALLCFQELTRHPTQLLVGAHRGGENDLTTYFLRALEWPRIAWQRDGQFPGWNPYLSLGAPTIGNPQALLSYPPNWLCWWFGAVPMASWLLVAHHWWAGLGCYLLARQMGVRRASAMLAGVVGMAAPYAIAHTAEGHYAQTCMMAWLPWTLWAFERFLSTRGERWLPVAVCLALSFFAGHVQETYYLALLMSGTVAMTTVTTLWSRSGPHNTDTQRERHIAGHPLQPLFRWCLVGVATVGLVAIDLIPTFINSRLTIRAGGLPLSTSGDGLKPRHLAQLWNSAVLDGETASGSNGFWETLLYFGLVPTVLAVIAVVRGGHRLGTWRLALLVLVTLLFAFGSMSSFFRMCHAWLPGIASFRSPARVLYISSMLVAALAAVGWDSFWPTDWDASKSRRRLRLIATALILGTVSWELGSYATRVLATTSTATRQDTAVSQFLRDQAGNERVIAQIGVYSDNEAVRDGLQKPQGYEPFPLSRFALAITALTPPGVKADLSGFQSFRLQDLHKPIADLLGIRYAVTHAQQPALAGWQRVATGKIPPEVIATGTATPELPFAIFENETVLPRAFVIGNVTVGGESPTKAVVPLLKEIQLRDSVLLLRDVWGNVPRATFAPATIAKYSPNEVVVHAAADGHGYLVLTDLFHPGWSAVVDGQSTNILPANVSFRAVPLTPGEHRVTFRFSPPGWRLGAIVSAVSWLGAIALTLFHHRRIVRHGQFGQREKFDVTDVGGRPAPAIGGLSGEATELAKVV